MKLIVMLTLAVMAGCATSPADVVERGTRFSGAINKAPIEAAKCIARNAEYMSGSLLASVSDIDNGAEVIVRGTAEVTTTLSLWRLQRSGAGSTYEVWVTPTLLGSPDIHIQRVRGAC